MDKDLFYPIIKHITKQFKTVRKSFKAIFVVILYVFAVLFVVSVKVVYAGESFYENYMSAALDAIEAGRYEEAKEYLEKAREINPSSEELNQFLQRINYLQSLRKSPSYQEKERSLKSQDKRIRLMEQVLREEEMKKALLQEELRQFSKAKTGKIKVKAKPKEKEKKKIVSKRRDRLMWKALLRYEKKIQKGFIQRPVQPVPVGFEEKQLHVSEEQRKGFIHIELELGYPVVVVFPERVKHFVVVDPSLLQIKKISDYQLEFSATSERLGSTVVYVWDTKGRWMFNVNSTPPKRKIERQLKLAKAKQRLKEDLLLTYNAYWSTFYNGLAFKDLHRTSLSFTQSFSLKGPTSYGRLSSQISIVKAGSGYKANYKFVGLDHIHRFGFKDGRIVSGDFFAGISELTFPGSSLEGFLISENRQNWSILAFRGAALNYWSSVPIVGGGNKPINGIRLRFKDLYLNMAYKNEEEDNYIQEGQRYLSDKVVSVELDKEINDKWKIRTEVGFDDEQNWAGVADINRASDKWQLHLNLRNVGPNYRTVSGSPIYSGEVGGELELSYNLGNKGTVSSSLNLYKDRSYSALAKRVNVEYSLQWNKVRKRDSYKVRFNYYSRAAANSRIDTYLLQAYYSRSSSLFHRSLRWRLGASYSQNRDKVFSQDISVERLFHGIDWEVMKDWLSVYENFEVGRVRDWSTGQEGWPRAFEFGMRLSHKMAKNRWYWYVSSSYRMESGGDMAYSFVSNRDVFTLRGRLSYEVSSDKNMYMQANLKKYYPKGESAFLEAEIYVGLSWLWDTGINLLPKMFIYGTVFEDLNMNGKQDKNEKGLAGIRIKCNGKTVKTDANGRYEIGWIKCRRSFVSVILSDLPSGMFPQENRVPVVPENGTRQEINLPIRYLSGVQGVAFVDTNQNGKLDVDEELLEGVRICIGDVCRFTDTSGGFVIDTLPAGQYKMSVDLTTLPENCLPAVPVTQTIVVTQGKITRLFIPVYRVAKSQK